MHFENITIGGFCYSTLLEIFMHASEFIDFQRHGIWYVRLCVSDQTARTIISPKANQYSIAPLGSIFYASLWVRSSHWLCACVHGVNMQYAICVCVCVCFHNISSKCDFSLLIQYLMLLHRQYFNYYILNARECSFIRPFQYCTRLKVW